MSLDLIPASRRSAVQAGLQAAFGTTVFDSIEAMKGGMSSALVFRIELAGRPYMLRLTMQQGEFNRDQARHFACLKAAAAAGLAPRVHHTDVDAGLTIVDFIAAKQLSVFDCPRPTLLAELATAIRRLQALAPFPPLGHYLDGVDKLIAELRAAGTLPAAADEVFERYAVIPAAYPRDPADLVSTHNDLNPTNTLWAQGRLWIVDWEIASLNDRYVDPAYVCNQFGLNPAEENTFLTHVFAGPPSDHQRARVHLMRQACQLFFAVILFRVAAAARPGLRLSADDLATPPLAEVRRQMVQLMATSEGQVQIAAATLNDLRANLRSDRFAEALRLVQS